MSLKFRARMAGALRIAIALTVIGTAFLPATSQAFTLIARTQLYVNPNVGYTTSLVQVRAVHTSNVVACSTQLSFRFTFDSQTLWARSVANCNPNTFQWDTAFSAYLKPPVPAAAGTHLIAVGVYVPGGALAQGGTAQFAYKTVNPPASPRTQPPPTPSPTPTPDCASGAVAVGCPSPTAQACPAAMLPPSGTGGWGDNTIAALMVGAALPIAGLAIFGPQTLLAAAYRRRRFLTLFGLSAMAVLALNCTFPTASNPQTSPAAAVTPSAASTPSSCSA